MKTTRYLILSVIILLLSVSAVGAQNSQLTLRQAADPGFMVGAAVEPTILSGDAAYNQTLAREYNTLVAENAMKFRSLSPNQGEYNFTAADTLVSYAQANGMQVRGHTLVWHAALPTWLINGSFTRDQMIDILRTHIYTVVGHYKGQVAVWDVVNEAVLSTGLRTASLWLQRIGPEYLDMAFRFAREADPNARLFYNDYSAEGLGTKSDQVYNLVKGMVERGVPIDGVGLQMHVRIDKYPNPADITANIERLAALGLEVQITEMDVQIQNSTAPMEERLMAQAQVYQTILEVCLNQPACTGFVTWGFTDRYSWIAATTGNPDMPLPFDINYQIKPAYTLLQSELAAITPPVEPPPPTPQPLPIPDHPAVLVDVQPNGGQLAVNFRLFKIEGLYGLEANCSADPNVLGGLTRADGDGFNASNSFFIDQGFNATSGAWLVAASRLLPAEPIAGDLTAFSLGYTLKNSGDPKLNCTLRAVDRNGRDLTVEVINGTVAPLQPAAVVQPDLMQPPVEMPVILVPGEAQFSSVAGVVTYANPTDNTGINVELMGGDYEVLAQIVTSVNGAYQFTDVPAGAYYLRASAPGHLQVLKTILVDGNSPVVDLSTDTLIAGDTDNNGTVDILDASFIGANFNLQAPPAPLEIDLNRDNLVNIGDLVLVGTNFGATSPGQ